MGWKWGSQPGREDAESEPRIPAEPGVIHKHIRNPLSFPPSSFPATRLRQEAQRERKAMTSRSRAAPPPGRILRLGPPPTAPVTKPSPGAPATGLAGVCGLPSLPPASETDGHGRCSPIPQLPPVRHQQDCETVGPSPVLYLPLAG